VADDAPSAFSDPATDSTANPKSSPSPPSDAATKQANSTVEDEKPPVKPIKKPRNPMEELIRERRERRVRELSTKIDETKDKYERMMTQHVNIREELLEVPMEKVRSRFAV